MGFANVRRVSVQACPAHRSCAEVGGADHWPAGIRLLRLGTRRNDGNAPLLFVLDSSGAFLKSSLDSLNSEKLTTMLTGNVLVIKSSGRGILVI